MIRKKRFLLSVLSAWTPLFLFGAVLVLQGCLLHRAKKAEREAQCSPDELRIQRRFFVSPQGQLGINGEPGSFAREIVAALNALPYCSAILMPIDFPIDPPPGHPPGPSQELQAFVASAGSSPAIDELLIVYVTDVVPFRPMRLSAILERRSLVDGMVISRDHRTWNAPIDLDPTGPSAANRKLLNHPPPAGIAEIHELSRLSPRTFQHGIATELALELANSPL